ncbi:hypothetical protein like AT4G38062 [Hibiscus trionum]|uniref:Uncharacterized protein n=1 Tax=Hibiscus trionum TaxID=183268 RepID=A0A9W7GYZ1_HIBTR|nr:hypothetical protein like AT4G38062 [Hibiscus trionum]
MGKENVYEELEEIKVENEKLRADFISKVELCENLKKVQNEQVAKIGEASSKIEKLEQQLLEKEEEIASVKRWNEDLKGSLNEKESIVKHLNAANDKLRAERDEKNRSSEQEIRRLVLALDEANELSTDQEQKINVLKAEIEGLKGVLSVSKKKCLEAEKGAKNPRELRERDDLLVQVEEEKRKVEDQLKWRKEQFKHLEEAHEKLRDRFKASKKEWEQEKSTLLDEISSLQTRLDSQIRVAGDLQNRLQICNQVLAHEETRRKYLEVEISEFKTRYETIFSECQDVKSQLDRVNSQRDNEIASLRHKLSTKESFYKEMEYRTGKLEQENRELLTSLKELQEARIQEAGSSSSLSKLKNRLKSLEQKHKECSTNLRAKEAEWNSQQEEMIRKLNDYSSQLQRKDAALKVLEMELEGCLSSAVQLKLQNEEISVTLLVLKSGISEARLKLANVEAELGLREKEREEKYSILRQQLEMKDTALANARKDIAEEREQTTILSLRVDTFDQVEGKHQIMEKELNRCKEMLEESSRCQLSLKEQALQVENDLKEKIREVCDALDAANSELAVEREKVASLLRRVESLDVIEGQRLLLQKELERYKEMHEEASRSRVHFEEQALQIENESKEKLREVCDALERAKYELTEERERTASLMKRVESLYQIEERLLQTQEELERHKEMLEDACRSQCQLEEQSVQMKNDFGEKLQEVFGTLETANVELAEERDRTATLTKQIQSSGHLEEQLALRQKELERHKEMLEDACRSQCQLEEQSVQMKNEFGEKLQEVCDALETANLELAEERERTATLTKQIQSSGHLEGQLALRQKELEKYKEMFEEASRCQLRLEEQISQTGGDSERELKEVQDALEKANSELVEKTCEGHELEFELWLWKSIVYRLKLDLEEGHALRKELEASLLSQAEVEETINKEKDELVRITEEKDGIIVNLQQQIASLVQELEARELEAVNAAEENIHQLTKEHENNTKLSTDRENLLGFITSLGDQIGDLSGEDSMLMGMLGSIVQSFDNDTSDMKTSEALVDELKSENRNLLENNTKLSTDRENLLGFITSLGDRIGELSGEDGKLMGNLSRIVQSFGNELYDSLKENKKNVVSSQATRKPDSVIEERSPFRELN